MENSTRFLNWVETYPMWELLIPLIALLLLVITGTHSEMISLGASAATCTSSGCVRADAIGAVLMILVAPMAIHILLGLGYLSLLLGVKYFKVKCSALRIFFLTLSPFLLTSIPFYIATMKIYEPGYGTERRLLAYCLIKLILLTLNWVIFITLVKLTIPSLRKTLAVLVLPTILFALVFNMDYQEASPNLHYLSEKQTYELAKLYGVDKTIQNIHCELDHGWCLNEFVRQYRPPMTPIR